MGVQLQVVQHAGCGAPGGREAARRALGGHALERAGQVPLRALVDKFSHTRFEPSGFTNNREIPIAKSVMDYVFRFLGNRFLQSEAEVADFDGGADDAAGTISLVGDASSKTAIAGGSGRKLEAGAGAGERPSSFVNQADAPSCMDCGSIMLRNGACYKCPNCGSTSGCS